MNKLADTAKIVVFANQKGGCGKTAMANEFAAGLKSKGFRVLAIDMDPQGNLSEGARAAIGTDIPAEAPSMYELIKGQVNVEDAIYKTPRYDIIPANIYLASAEQEISTNIGREYILRDRLEPIRDKYDYIVIDTPPALGTLTVNSMTAADEIIIPILPDLYAAGGVKKLYEAIRPVQKHCNPTLKIAGVVFTQFDDRTNNSQNITAIMEALMTELGIKRYKTKIRKSVTVSDARTFRLSLSEYREQYLKAKKPQVLVDYELFINEYLADKEA